MAATEVATNSVDSVTFSFLTDEEVRKYSFVKITNPRLLDMVERPIPGGLYDPALGPLSDKTLCKTCSQRQTNCPGHCGHIDLISPVYNPLLFNFLFKLLQKTCFFCQHFRMSRGQVEKCVAELELIVKGDIVGAKRLDSVSPSEALYPECSDESLHSSSITHSGDNCLDEKHSKNPEWTSLQYTEAMSVLNKFLKLNFKKCKNCEASNPKISKPTYGWLYMNGMSGGDIRSNVIRNQKLEDPTASDSEGITDLDDEVEPPGFVKSATKTNKKKGGQVSDFAKQKGKLSRQLLPSEVKSVLELLWQNEAQVCAFISDLQQQGLASKKGGPSMFFLETILVPPTKFRPPTKGGDSVMEHPQTVLLSKVLQSNISLGDAHVNKEHSKVPRRWLELQQTINILFDSKTANGPGQRDVASGICQLLEKKEGLFRQKMMGKRVNYACRSVISPDPYLGVNEIGIPPCFAVKLTYPERVTPWNIGKLRNGVINGPECHPGATHYVDKLSVNKLPPNRKTRISISRKLPSSRGAIMQSGKRSDYENEGKVVYRHLQDGDVVLVNRQPTLHKPSIMAHIVRVLKGERTLRMHYANCSTYNADFDGDEMNVHFPQDEISRAEAYNIVNANNQYVRPTTGEPIRSLIQDHIVSAALLTKRDTFLSQHDFDHLLYISGVSATGPTTSFAKPGQKVFMLNSEDSVHIPLPAILKPVPLWTGKQVITTVLNHITRGHPPLNVEKDGKIPSDFFKTRIKEDGRSVAVACGKNKESNKSELDMDKQTGKEYGDYKPMGLEEDKMVIFRNEFVRGVIDKAQFGEYGLVHTVEELFGSNTAGTFLSVLSRLFTAYLQMHGFTCGVDDLLIMKYKDDQRRRLLECCAMSGELIHRNFIGVKDGRIKIEPMELQSNIEKTIRCEGDSASTYLDRQMSNEVNSKTSSGVIRDLLSEGILKPSGKNCISLMTISGAKGSKVNFQQISSFLGQQDLEGKRVPRMVSGKTLPCFHPWDWTARAGGYIIDRFLTGLRPQEYYFHCMAGREGLVDTAVKTSRSGYLQRCLIKNLECLKVHYDHTVRDADGSVVQFQYGEDGVDVHRTSFIGKLDLLAANQEVIRERYGHARGAFNSYILELPQALKEKADRFLDDFSLMDRKISHIVRREDVYQLMKQKFFSSLAHPGEPVGVLAAQSVGEPSTQMTLNTFHLAGRGEMNVTLGIPRLQEILMTASSDIKTPIMSCPLQEGKTREDADILADNFKKVTVADIVESMEVSVKPFAVYEREICRIYKLKMKLYKPAHYPQFSQISSEDWEETLKVMFVRALEDAIENHLQLLSRISGIKNYLPQSQSKASDESEEATSDVRKDYDADDNDEYDEGAEDLGLDAEKRKVQATDEMDYDDDFEEDLNEGDSSASEETSEVENEMDTPNNGTDGIKDDGFENDTPGSPPLGGHTKRNSRSKTSQIPSKAPLNNKKKKPESGRKKGRRKLVKKDYDRTVFVEANDKHFELHLKFTNEPHVLLAEIAQRTAKKVYIQNPGKIERCQVTDCQGSQVIYYGKDPKKRISLKAEEKSKIPALHTAGVDFSAFWKMQDDLDVRYIYSNNIHAMLKTYGVEAARETIIREVKHVFSSYAVSVNERHLTLIADFMTHTGEYRAMSRVGGISDSVSPFSKMTFETASKFIVEAALHGETDHLETPSARICLGLPVKMGTGSFDVMQNLAL
ncbi:hypothetical protein K2173_020858 [Erythroxylum novogranatense]|uniref:DNA-directed RNA polymerase subunit n=1 Tax=Erythroxylum novogranatense TaxID=1862640 RepID=A0AAV8TNZ8_9ROSI|nr:hypothetical protein K2173_020858 [Erythroxylum novogranatense]